MPQSFRTTTIAGLSEESDSWKRLARSRSGGARVAGGSGEFNRGGVGGWVLRARVRNGQLEDIAVEKILQVETGGDGLWAQAKAYPYAWHGKKNDAILLSIDSNPFRGGKWTGSLLKFPRMILCRLDLGQTRLTAINARPTLFGVGERFSRSVS